MLLQAHYESQILKLMSAFSEHVCIVTSHSKKQLANTSNSAVIVLTFIKVKLHVLHFVCFNFSLM